MQPHPLLQRQLKKFGLEYGSLPNDLKPWNSLVDSINLTYQEDEEQQTRLTRAWKVSNRHFREKNALLVESEALYSSLAECIPLSVFRIDLQGRLTFANRLFCETFDASYDDVLGKNCYDFYPNLLAEGQRLEDQKVIKTKESTEATIDYQKSNGDLVFFQVWKSPIFDPTDNVIGLQGIFWDITILKNYEKSLENDVKRQAHQYQALFENSKDAIFTTTSGGKILKVNKAMQDLYGYSEKQILKMNAVEFYVNPEDRSKFQNLMDKDGSVKDFEVKFRRKDKSQVDVLLTAHILRDHNGNMIGYQGIHHDITERKLREIELRIDNINLRAGVNTEDRYETMAGRSKAMRKIKADIKEIAGADPIVLITGETGTGKNLLAYEIHKLSRRSSGQFMKVSCPNIPETLIDTILFGSEEGIYTGAKDKDGQFQLADGGTIFLDEIGDLPFGLQAKLLRVIQDQEFERVGGKEVIKVDVRIIAATNRDLEKDMREGKFRSDLYFRLNVYPIECPPLRERIDDIPILVEHIVNKFNSQYKKSINHIPREVMDTLKSHDWPGNIRELENVIETAVITSKGNDLTLRRWQPVCDLLPKPENVSKSQSANVSSIPNSTFLSLREIKRNHILCALNESNWKKSGPDGAADKLRISPSKLDFEIKNWESSDPIEKGEKNRRKMKVHLWHREGTVSSSAVF